MNRFDRVTSILLLLQTRSVVTARFLADRFSVTERTVYRDIRTLENAGVPIGSEAGVGYFLDKGYHLPPVSFTLDEAASVLMGEKLLASALDADSLRDYRRVLNKVRAVLDASDKDYLSSLDRDIEVMYEGRSPAPADTAAGASSGDRWVRECRDALVRRSAVDIDYSGGTPPEATSRRIEPIGLFHYSAHWHLIAWCRSREGYRDFRLDRIERFEPAAETFPRHGRATLQQYLARERGQEHLVAVDLLFSAEAARFAGERRHAFGLVDEERTADGVRMSFLTSVPHYMARWLLQFGSGVRVLEGEGLRPALRELSAELSAHWGAEVEGPDAGGVERAAPS